MTVRIGVTCLMVIGLLATGCAGRSSYPDAGQSPTASSHPSQSAATIGGELGAPTARRIVDELATAGFEVPKPRDTTAQECPCAGCNQSIVTDTLRVKSFPSTGLAETYAADRGLHQIATIVVSFAPPLTPADQDRYWAEVQKLVR